MPKCMFSSDHLWISLATGKQMPSVLCNNIGDSPISCDGMGRSKRLFLPCIGEVVVGIHLFEKRASCKVPNSSCGSGGIEHTGHLICSRIECIVICRFIHPHSPHDEGGVISITNDHLFQLLNETIPPELRWTDMLPSGNLLEHEQTDLIT